LGDYLIIIIWVLILQANEITFLIQIKNQLFFFRITDSLRTLIVTFPRTFFLYAKM